MQLLQFRKVNEIYSSVDDEVEGHDVIFTFLISSPYKTDDISLSKSCPTMYAESVASLTLAVFFFMTSFCIPP